MIFKHSGDLGDIIYTLPVIKYHGGGILFLNTKKKKKIGRLTGLNDKKINQLIPLLSRQSYIIKVKKHDDEQYDIDLDSFRKIKNFPKRKNLCHFILETYKTPISITENPWLFAEEKKISRIVFHRSCRYHNKNAIPVIKNILSEKRKDSLFIGLQEEFEIFCREIGKIKYLKTDNLWELACIIKGSETFIGNQSCPMAIAIGLGKNYIQEVCPELPDCIFNNYHGRYILDNEITQNVSQLL